ncbi:MAG: hypothetical protein PHV13_04065 [Candidatus ainarchaeum sp.]|nr:hypothetical protein [Candidatus ainarchaeum sp.]
MEGRIEALSKWLVQRMRTRKQPVGAGLNGHLNDIADAVLELHRDEPFALSLAKQALHKEVVKAVLEVDGERFERKFEALIKKHSQLDPNLREYKEVYVQTANFISLQIATELGNVLCLELSRLVRSGIEEQGQMVA